MPKYGIRRLQLDELAKLKGLTNSKYTNTSFSVLFSSIEQHVRATVYKGISSFILTSNTKQPVSYKFVFHKQITTPIFPLHLHHTTQPMELDNSWFIGGE